MNFSIFTAVCALLALAACTPPPAATSPTATTQAIPHADAADPARQAIVDALTSAIAHDLGQPVRLRIDTLRTQGDWAWVEALPQTPAGGAIDFSHTHYAVQDHEGALDGGGAIHALLHKDAPGWVVRAFDLGSTDVAYLDWPQRYGAPGELMGLGAQ